MLKDHFSVAEPPAVAEKISATGGEDDLRDFRQAFAFGIGGSVGNAPGSSKSFGFQYLLPSATDLHYEGGADIFNDGSGAFHFGIRRFMKAHRFRGYYKAGLALRTDGESGLAEFVQLSNLRGRAAVGFEKLWISPLSYRLETEASLGKDEQIVILRAALSWAWY